MKTCHECQRELTAYISGELSASARHALREHLKTCAECSAELEATEALGALLTPELGTKAPAELLSGIMAACHDQRKHQPPRRYFLQGAAVGLAAVLALLAIMSAPRPTGAPKADIRQASAAKTFTAADLGTARRELAWTMTTTSRVVDRAGKQVIGDIFGHRIPHAISSSLHQALTTKPKGRS